MGSEEEKEDIEIPLAWRHPDLTMATGTVMVLGGTGSGKSTFARWLVAELKQVHERIGWLDADVGQTTLGVPATMNLALADRQSGPMPAVKASFFVGSTSPRGHMLPVMVGLHLLRELAIAEGATAMVVDTSGFTGRDEGGGALKEWKIALLRPRAVVALQEKDELEHILAPLRRDAGMALHVFAPSGAVRPRSQKERSERRRQLFRNYFADAAEVRVDIRHRPVFGLGKAAPGRLTALQDQTGFSLALGVIQSGGGGWLKMVTPLADTSLVASLRLGDMLLDPATGEEFYGCHLTR